MQADVAIVGGGLAGLTSSIILAKAGLQVVVIDKKSYPHHKVCGEYVSNEVLPFLQQIGADPAELQPARINRLVMVSGKGTSIEVPLEMGGFGLSRYTFDDFLYRHAQAAGVQFLLERQVNDVKFLGGRFFLELSEGEGVEADVTIGAFGKRSRIDNALKRKFFRQRSPWLAVKYHIRGDVPSDVISVYNFEGGYCGLNAVEGDKACLCYLTRRDNLKKYGAIPDLERALLWKNPRLKAVFQQAEILYKRPEVINEISFANKDAVSNHILMAGDAAGMITPVCGNGMAMAMNAAKICAEEVVDYFLNHGDRAKMEREYTMRWNQRFARRMWMGRLVQKLIVIPTLSEVTLALCRTMRPLPRWIVRQTHGQPF